MELDNIKLQTTWNDAAGSINNNFAKVKTALEQGGGGSLAVDEEMSDTSENAVQNKTIKKYVDEEAERVVGYAEEVADNAEKAAKQYADDNKVAKVEGKQLSTEDFTTTLKQKLEGLTNYDDADVRSAITELQNNLDAIVNGDATSAIDSIQEILAFLSTIADTDTLAGIIANLQGLIAANTTKTEALEESVDAELAKRPEPLIIEAGIDFPSETATGTIDDFAVSYETVKAAMESGSNIEMVEANGNRHSCTFFYDDGENGIIIRATTHTTNESHIRMLVFVQGTSVVVWRSNYHILQEQLVSGQNIATVNGQSLLEGGNIEIVTEEKEVYIGSDEPTDDGAKLWIDPTGTPSSPSQPSESVEVVDNLESDSTTAALSANQGRVLKEMIPSVRIIHAVMAGFQYTEEQRAYNIETYALARANAPCIYYINSAPLALYSVKTNAVSFLSYSWIVNGGKEQFVVGEIILNEDGSLGVDMKLFNLTSLKE